MFDLKQIKPMGKTGEAKAQIDEQAIISLVRMKGPVIPSQINKELNTNVLFASAMLSELVDQKKLKLTSLKVGGSPVYYIDGQEYKLQNYTKYLNEKDQKTCELLKGSKILKDSEQIPLTRASLRMIKDFAAPLEVNLDGQKEIFWKWYLTPHSEAESIIRDKLKERLEIKEKQKRLLEDMEKKQLERERLLKDGAMEEAKKKEDMLKEKTRERTEKVQKKPLLQTAKEKIEKIIKKDDSAGEKKEERAEEGQPKFVDTGFPNDKFFKRIKNYFDSGNIKITKFKIIRKESDIEFEIVLPSNIGNLTYFCKAKDKKRCNDGDLSSIFINAQRKKMPVLFITTGDLTKKANELLVNEFKSITFKKI